MSNSLPRLRMDLDFMPSPVEDRPGLLMRDPFHYSEATLIIPPLLVPVLELFDGEHTDLDLRQALVRATGELQVGELEQHLTGTLSSAGFLHDDQFATLQAARHEAFRAAPTREPVHAGSAYPDDVNELRGLMQEYLAQADPSFHGDGLVGLAAPHVSPFGGWESYREAYSCLAPEYADRTFVILGTSHYGAPDTFGLTRKAFTTPFGEAETDLGIVDQLAQTAPGAVRMEDYCHAIEHSIEFQVIFLQMLLGPKVKIVPILCGPYSRSVHEGGMPEDNEQVKRFLEALGEIHVRDGRRLLWVLGVDMAHMGARYGDRLEARVGEGAMQGVEMRDRERIECLSRSDAAGFWSLVQQNQDDLKWCGSAPFYTFLRAVPGVAGNLERYQQWNIDEQSVVSFAGMTFTKEPRPTRERRPSNILVVS